MEPQGEMMHVLARIPDIGADQAAAGAADGVPVTAVKPAPTPAPCRRPRASRTRFPMGSVMALAVMATVVWALASWNDGRRAEHSRMERLARMRPATTTTDTLQR